MGFNSVFKELNMIMWRVDSTKECGLDSSGSEPGPMVGWYKNGNEILGTVNYMEFLVENTMVAQEELCFLCLDKRVPDIDGFTARPVVSTQTRYAHLHLRQLLQGAILGLSCFKQSLWKRGGGNGPLAYSFLSQGVCTRISHPFTENWLENWQPPPHPLLFSSL